MPEPLASVHRTHRTPLRPDHAKPVTNDFREFLQHILRHTKQVTNHSDKLRRCVIDDDRDIAHEIHTSADWPEQMQPQGTVE